MIDELRSKLLGCGRAKGSIVGHASLAGDTNPLITTLAAQLLLVYGMGGVYSDFGSSFSKACRSCLLRRR